MNLHDAILTVLECHKGKENRIRREDLRWTASGKAGCTVGCPFSDREMRQAIEELRREHPIGALICSSSGVGGYWLAKDYDEVQASYNEERRRALTLMVTMRKRLHAARRHFGGQRTLL